MESNEKRYFAAYCPISIYAIGDSPESAIAQAQDDCRDLDAQFSVAEINPLFAEKITRDGFNPYRDSFYIKNGIILEAQ